MVRNEPLYTLMLNLITSLKKETCEFSDIIHFVEAVNLTTLAGSISFSEVIETMSALDKKTNNLDEGLSTLLLIDIDTFLLLSSEQLTQSEYDSFLEFVEVTTDGFKKGIYSFTDLFEVMNERIRTTIFETITIWASADDASSIKVVIE